MVPDSGLQDLFKGVVDPSPHPAVNVDALQSKPDLLLCEVLVLEDQRSYRSQQCKSSRKSRVKVIYL